MSGKGDIEVSQELRMRLHQAARQLGTRTLARECAVESGHMSRIINSRIRRVSPELLARIRAVLDKRQIAAASPLLPSGRPLPLPDPGAVKAAVIGKHFGRIIAAVELLRDIAGEWDGVKTALKIINESALELHDAAALALLADGRRS